MILIDSIKRRLHRDIVADPLLHGLVLNLYLNGERYPHRVDDYFPILDVRDPELADSMRRHAKEEDRHVLLYEKALEKLDQPAVELAMEDVFNEVIRSHTPVSFRMARDDDADARTLKVAHFLAHLHFLEKRIARSLEYHVEACAHSQCAYTEKAIGAVLHDEHRHVSYTCDGVRHLLPAGTATQVFALHRAAEHRANLDFSARQLRRLVREQRGHFPPLRLAAYGACAVLLKSALFYS